ncbi:uncharacterized protein LOC128276386 [Anopheles cruzii]|uniref:uncharacterized protein LOC128276386 n=1 Tax=Anopheles cruzii TaxID=68878 RepID=UPI0022EC7C0F|nr:uncharacterized protein LOC128276386 [Anopheles cruzii]
MSLPAEDTEIESFPALAKLKNLNLRTRESDMPLFRDALNLPTNSPRLEQLKLGNDEGAFFNVLEHFSPQLKVVKVNRVSEEFFLLNFPRLRELELFVDAPITSELSLDFFRRHSSIQELKINNAIPLDLFQIITTHCRNITYLRLVTSNHHRKGDFKSLDQLTKLKHLEIVNAVLDDVRVDVFEGCGVISSLEKMSFHENHNIHRWSFLTKQIAPELKCLEFIESFYVLP